MSHPNCKGCYGDRDYHSDACNYYPKSEGRIDSLRKEIADLRAKLAERDAALAASDVCRAARMLAQTIEDCAGNGIPYRNERALLGNLIRQVHEAIDSLPPSAKADAEILAAADDFVRDYDAGELADLNRLRQAISSKQSAGEG